jgi:divalent metal cation (Fe/Co/Zn/Cd) transporter
MSTTESAAFRSSRRILHLQVFTMVWMMVEAAVSLFAAWRAHSPALLGFGGDSAIELLSAAVVFWRFCSNSNPELAERYAARIAGALLIVLALFVAITSVLSLLGYRQPQTSRLGIAVLLLAAVIMPWLAREKRKLAAATSSAALRADAAESALCGYLAWIALAGVLLNALWAKSWADPLAALLLIPLILREGWEALHSSKPSCARSE